MGRNILVSTTLIAVALAAESLLPIGGFIWVGIAVVLGAIVIHEHREEIRERWLLLREKENQYYGTVEQVSIDNREMSVVSGAGVRFHLVTVPFVKDKNRPPVSPGDMIVIYGKMIRPMKGGYSKIVDCKIRLRE